MRPFAFQVKVRVVCIVGIVRGIARALKRRLNTVSHCNSDAKKKGAQLGALFFSVEDGSDQVIR